MDTICTSKPSDRLNGADTYESLDELMAFAGRCESLMRDD